MLRGNREGARPPPRLLSIAEHRISREAEDQP